MQAEVDTEILTAVTTFVTAAGRKSRA
jgi:hypothetical protein